MNRIILRKHKEISESKIVLCFTLKKTAEPLTSSSAAGGRIRRRSSLN